MCKAQRYFAGLLAVGLLLGLSNAFAATVSTAQLTGALHWRSVGPYVGGRATSVAGVAGKPNLYYAAYAGGGVWKTDDYGRSWKNISDKYFKTNDIGAIAVAPSNPRIIYVGAGDSAPRNTFLPAGGMRGGMYKSTDGGKTWTHIGLEKTHVISWIIVDPNNPEAVYVAALGHVWKSNKERGVYKTTDGGKTWKKVLYVNDKTGAITLAMDPRNPEVVYAAMWQMYRRHWTLSSGGPGSGIYKTTDGGTHWSNITHNQGLPKGIFGKVGLAVAPSDPNVVYALIQAKYKPGHPGGLFRSDNGGQSWKLMNDSLKITQRAFYYSRVYVDPKDANTVYLPNAGVFVSHDGGKKLKALHPPHGDNHAFWINPDNPQSFIEGNDGGATVSLDGGKSWSSEDNQPTGQFYHANLDEQFPFWIYGAQQDNSPRVGPSAVRRGGIPGVWTTVQGAEDSWILPQPGSPWITISSGFYGQLWKDNRKTGVVTEISTWPAYKFGLGGDKIKYRYGWNHHAIAFAPGNPNELLVGANVLFESTDQGIHWKRISPDLTRNDKSKQRRPGGPISADVTGEEMYDTISSIAVSPVNQSIIWVGSDDGLVHLTTDGGGHWKEVRPPSLPTWSTITCIEPSHTQAGTAYVSASRYDWDDFHPYVYKTTDYGKHWVKITAGLPDNQYVESVRQDPDEPGLLFAGTSVTVYMSLDGGSHWLPLSLNLPAVRVNDIAIQPAQHAVVLATFGRAFWVLDNLQFLEQLSAARVSSNAPYLFKPQQTWLVTRHVGGFGGPARNEGENLKPGVTVFFHLPADYNSKMPVKLSFTDASGKLIRSFTLPEKPKKKLKKTESAFGASAKKPEKLHPGMNRFMWNFRYPDAVFIKGIFHTGLGASVPVGPQVVPGTYYVALSYDGYTQKQPFVVKLDPRLKTTRTQLQARFNLLMQIRAAINSLDSTVNRALAARSRLQKATAAGKVSADRANKAVAALTKDINSVVDLKIQSGESGLVYPPRLRAWLTWIAGNVSLAFVAPTTVQTQVATMYINQAHSSVSHLQTDVAQANEMLKR